VGSGSIVTSEAVRTDIAAMTDLEIFVRGVKLYNKNLYKIL